MSRLGMYRREPRRVLMTTGDVNALNYGGGIVYRDKYGTHWDLWYSDDEDQDKYEVFTIDIPDDVIAEFNWVNWDSVANSIGMDLGELEWLGRSRKVGERVGALDAAVGHEGMYAFDQYPVSLTRAELKRRWPRQL